MDRIQLLLVNPPIYDFTAFDFWLRPYGLLRVAGRMRRDCDITLFEYLVSVKRDRWGRGKFPAREIPRPAVFQGLERRYRRFGRPREEFRRLLRSRRFDAVLIQTVMTWWYPGIHEVIQDIRDLQPWARIVLGGVYATLCGAHAATLAPDFIVTGSNLDRLWSFLEVRPSEALPYWDSCLREVGVMKLTEGCPFRCTYCAAPLLYPRFRGRPIEQCLEELRQLILLGARHVAFYDDALLFRAEQILAPFLEEVIRRGLEVSFHTPNALNARFLSPEIARLMVRAGFRTFFLGFENSAEGWQKKTGGKVRAEEFARAVRVLRAAGAEAVTAYIIAGHPESPPVEIESSMLFAHEQGARILLAEFAPIPGTPDGERCSEWVDLREPLNHNKTAFTLRILGPENTNRLKSLCRDLNLTL